MSEIRCSYEEEINHFQIKNDVQADKLLEEIRDSEVEHSRIEIIAKAKIDSINQELLRSKEKMQKEVDFKRDQLRAYFLDVIPTETKTMKKYKLFTGELITKKSSKIFIVDKDKILKSMEKSKDETYIKIKKELDWTNFKRALEIKKDLIINKETGEIVKLDGLEIIEKPEEFQVKIN